MRYSFKFEEDVSVGPSLLITTCKSCEHLTSSVSAHIKLKFDANVAGKVTTV